MAEAKFMQIFANEAVAGDVLQVGEDDRRVRKVTKGEDYVILWWEPGPYESHTKCELEDVFDLSRTQP